MKIGCPKEIKSQEFRTGLIPAAVKAYVEHGHQVSVEQGAGLGSGITDEQYEQAGARIVATAREVWEGSQMIVKVKEPLASEHDLMQPGQLVYTYFHFAANEKLTLACLEKKISAIAYETVQEEDGSLPLLKPMSEVAGRMAPLMGAFYLGKPFGGRGLLPTGVPGVAPANVLILGGGTVGSNAAKVAAGFGARVTLLDINLDTLEHIGNIMPANVSPIHADAYTLEKGLKEADIVIGAVLVTGARAPKIVKREHLGLMKPGSVIVDVAIDQGGCVETSRATTHSDPVYLVDGVVHYCVANMPGAYSRSSTFALSNRTGKYGLLLADMGVENGCLSQPALLRGLNIHNGWITFKPVCESFDLEGSYKPAREALGSR
ncbi:MAG: alanine dehydrogenase [Syntrophobacteraceae bacterium]|nr:alanine dehydrogenase [Syntrophobacteraceae bacterium]